MEAMRGTESGRERLRVNEERIDRSMAEQIEAADSAAAAAHPRAPRQARGFLERSSDWHAPEASAPHAERPRWSEAKHVEELMRMPTGIEPREDTAQDRPAGIDAHAQEPAAGDHAHAHADDDAEMEETAGNDVEMSFVGCTNANEGIGSLDPSLDGFVP